MCTIGHHRVRSNNIQINQSVTISQHEYSLNRPPYHSLTWQLMECSCRQLQQLMGSYKQLQLLELSGAGHLTSTPGILCTPGQCHLPENPPDTTKWLNSSLAMVELPASQLQQLQKHLKHPHHHPAHIKTCENFEHKKVKT